MSVWSESLTLSDWLDGRRSGLQTQSDSGLRPYWNSSARSTLHHQPLRRSLRNTNQPSATTLPTLPPSSSSCPPPLTPSLVSVIRVVLLTHNKHHRWHYGVGIQVLYVSTSIVFVLLVMSGASSEESAPSGGSREWILMTSWRQRKSGRILSIYPPPTPPSPSCLGLTYGPSARSRHVFTGFVSLWLWLISRWRRAEEPNVAVLKTEIRRRRRRRQTPDCSVPHKLHRFLHQVKKPESALTQEPCFANITGRLHKYITSSEFVYLCRILFKQFNAQRSILSRK